MALEKINPTSFKVKINTRIQITIEAAHSHCR